MHLVIIRNNLKGFLLKAVTGAVKWLSYSKMLSSWENNLSTWERFWTLFLVKAVPSAGSSLFLVSFVLRLELSELGVDEAGQLMRKIRNLCSLVK